MRVKAEAIFDFGPTDDEADNQTVRDYRDEYKRLGEILDRHGDVLDLVHEDLAQLSKATSTRGRKPVFTSENLFRAVLVMQREGLDYRQASIRIAESETLQRFCRLLKKPTMDFTLLNRAFAAIRPGPWRCAGASSLLSGCPPTWPIPSSSQRTESSTRAASSESS